jgi:hypothetical protein
MFTRDHRSSLRLPVLVHDKREKTIARGFGDDLLDYITGTDHSRKLHLCFTIFRWKFGRSIAVRMSPTCFAYSWTKIAKMVWRRGESP